MTTQTSDATKRHAGLTAILGAICALTGAALWGASGADIDAALATGDTAGYLQAAGDSKGLLVANLSIWILMALLFGIAGSLLSSLGESRPVLSKAATICYQVGVPLVIVTYVAWMAIVVQVAPDTSAEAVMMTKTLGWFASRGDWLATILIVGVGPTLIAFSGKDNWVPTWLLRWGYLTLLAGLLNAIAMFTGGAGLSTYGFVIIPVGVFWMLAAGVVSLRQQA